VGHTVPMPHWASPAAAGAASVLAELVVEVLVVSGVVVEVVVVPPPVSEPHSSGLGCASAEPASEVETATTSPATGIRRARM
jgi:hypothetical protein